MYNCRNVPRLHPNDSAEQTASRRREYWRIKKREQRAKQSMEVKNRLKEKDSLMRRVKRYQKILEEMRRARAQTLALELTHPTGSMLTHASETIGGFIKEDGTVTSNIPQVTTVVLRSETWEGQANVHLHHCVQLKYECHCHKMDLQCTSAAVGAGCLTPAVSPLRRAKRLCAKKSGNHHQHCCSPEPPKLHHHSPSEQQSQLQTVQPAPQPSRCLPQSQPTALQQQCRRSLIVESVGVAGSMGSISSLQKRREYWKLMKRQQRARSKARQKGSLSHRQNSRLLSSNTAQEEFLRRKREYWRVKKKEQRARKAIRDRELSQRRAPGNWKPIRPAMDQGQPQYTEKQDPGHWVTAYDDPDACFAGGRGGSGNVLFADGDHGEDDGSISDGAWRNRYLMDHDSLNQLLVCMVCGDLLYSHSLEGVRAHIEEAHPDTLNLEPPECRRILDAWDEQRS
ncbi:hypothetical protein CRUP_010767 [Coryphaenoides rupestris]|nr:hypothetical protein CRUP_010767 [Coryphaenoides rupestris]